MSDSTRAAYKDLKAEYKELARAYAALMTERDALQAEGRQLRAGHRSRRVDLVALTRVMEERNAARAALREAMSWIDAPLSCSMEEQNALYARWYSALGEPRDG
jgi:uncharacterized protein (DUF3084 family)